MAPTPWAKVGELLGEIARRENGAVLLNRRRVHGLVRDRIPAETRVIHLLMTAFDAGVPMRLRAVQQISDLQIEQEVQRIVADSGTSPDLARDAVLAWANAVAGYAAGASIAPPSSRSGEAAQASVDRVRTSAAPRPPGSVVGESEAVTTNRIGATPASVLSDLLNGRRDELLGNRRRLLGLLRDKAPEDLRTIRLLMLAFDQGVPSRLLSPVASELDVDREMAQFAAEAGTTPELARETVLAWARALGVCAREPQVTAPAVQPIAVAPHQTEHPPVRPLPPKPVMPVPPPVPLVTKPPPVPPPRSVFAEPPPIPSPPSDDVEAVASATTRPTASRFSVRSISVLALIIVALLVSAGLVLAMIGHGPALTSRSPPQPNLSGGRPGSVR